MELYVTNLNGEQFELKHTSILPKKYALYTDKSHKQMKAK